MPSTPPQSPKQTLPIHSPPTAPNSPPAKRSAPAAAATASLTEPLTNFLPQPTSTSTNSTESSAMALSADIAPTSADGVSQHQAQAEVPALQIQLLSEHGRAPTRGSAYAAGYDLYCSKDTTIPARGRAMAPTDISIAVPAGTYGRVAPRSGLAAKHGLQTGAGVIDADYRGPVFVLLFNQSDDEFELKAGDRCAQLVLERIVTPEVVVVEKLDETVRGAGGFGSTGGFAGKK